MYHSMTFSKSGDNIPFSASANILYGPVPPSTFSGTNQWAPPPTAPLTGYSFGTVNMQCACPPYVGLFSHTVPLSDSSVGTTNMQYAPLPIPRPLPNTANTATGYAWNPLTNGIASPEVPLPAVPSTFGSQQPHVHCPLPIRPQLFQTLRERHPGALTISYPASRLPSTFRNIQHVHVDSSQTGPRPLDATSSYREWRGPPNRSILVPRTNNAPVPHVDSDHLHIGRERDVSKRVKYRAPSFGAPRTTVVGRPGEVPFTHTGVGFILSTSMAHMASHTVLAEQTRAFGKDPHEGLPETSDQPRESFSEVISRTAPAVKSGFPTGAPLSTSIPQQNVPPNRKRRVDEVADHSETTDEDGSDSTVQDVSTDSAVDAAKKKKARKAELARNGRARKKANEAARRLVLVRLMSQATDLADEVGRLRSILTASGIPLPRRGECLNCAQ